MDSGVAGLAAAMAHRPAFGAALVTLAALVKAPAALALVFVAAIWASQPPGRWRWFHATLGAGAVGAGTIVAVTAITGTGYGWIGALRTPVSVHSWSVTGVLGRVTGALLEVLGVELATDILALWRWAGVGVAGGVCVLVWWRRAELGPVYALGLALTAVVLFGPAIRPWYLLWGLVPIAAAAPDGRLRRWAAWTCAGLAVVVLPDGYFPGAVQVGQAVLGGALAAAALVAVHYRHLILGRGGFRLELEEATATTSRSR